MKHIAAVAAGLLVLSCHLSRAETATASHGYFGTWVLDPARSQYARDAVPQHMTLIIAPDPSGLNYRSETQYSGGRTASAHFIARLDGTPALVVGTTGYLAPVSLSQVSEAQIEAVYTAGSKKIAWSHWLVNPEGTELQITTIYLGSDGIENQNVASFRRQSENGLSSGDYSTTRTATGNTH